MPDGGSDCCGTCVFNRQWGSYHDPELAGRRERFAECALRGIRTDNPFWTYCDWWQGGVFRRQAHAIRDQRPQQWRLEPAEVQSLVAKVLQWLSARGESFGPVYADGMYQNGYQRIPWDGPNEPSSRGTAAFTCYQCERQATDGIQIAPRDLGTTLGFCSNGCYIAWWLTRHPEPQLPQYRL